MSELELNIRQKELIMNFRRWCYDNNIEVFTSDTFRQFLREHQMVKRVLDTDKREKHGRVNVGAYFHLMLKAHNPLHRIRKLDVLVPSTIESNKKRGIHQYSWIIQ